MNNTNVGQYLVMYTTGKGKDEHIQYESFGAESSAWRFYKKLLRRKGVNRDTVTIYKQL